MWQRALTLAERLNPLEPQGPSEQAIDRAYARMDRWQSSFSFQFGQLTRALAAATSSNLNDLMKLFGEQDEFLAKRICSTPHWYTRLHSAYSVPVWTRSSPFASPNENAGSIGFLNLVLPQVDQATRRLADTLTELVDKYPAAPFTPTRMLSIALSNLPRLLLPQLEKVLALEVNIARLQEDLSGNDGQARFMDFCERLREKERALALFDEYPVLGRRVIWLLDTWVQSHLEVCTRLCADWDEIQAVFGGNFQGQKLVGLESGKGDRHRHGRSVVELTFSSGSRLMYKPRSMSIDVHFQNLIRWLNIRDESINLPTFKILDRGHYGWCEFVSYEECASQTEVQRFYKRQGAFLAILYLLDATDVFRENVIACGPNPYPIDLETLFHPRTEQDANDPARDALRNSVLRVGFLPHRTLSSLEGGVDLSALGSVEEQWTPFPVPIWHARGCDEMNLQEARVPIEASKNAPRLYGKKVSPIEHRSQLREGFSRTYRLIAEHKGEFLSEEGPLCAFANDETRVVLRPTMTYATLLSASTHPDYLRDATEVDVLYASLCVTSGQESKSDQLLKAEMSDLENGDIPVFLTRVNSTDLWTSSGTRIPAFFEASAFDRVKGRIDTLSESDFERQIWLIDASIATLEMSGARSHWPHYEITRHAADVGDTAPLEEAKKIGLGLTKSAILGKDGSASWITVNLGSSGRWSLNSAGVGLYDGIPGIVFFLAYLAKILNDEFFNVVARRALVCLNRKLDSDSSNFSIGAFDGLAGIMYLFAHLAYLWRDEEILQRATAISEDIRDRTRSDRSFDVLSGSAGALVCVLALHRAVQNDRLLDTAVALGEHLVEHAVRRGDGLAWKTHIPATAPLTGFSHGASGIGWALLELAEASQMDRFLEAGLAAFRYERDCFADHVQNWPDYRKIRSPKYNGPLFEMGWCHGAPGIALSRLRAVRHIDREELRKDAIVGIQTTLRSGFGGSHCLCHGDLGNLEILLESREVIQDGTQNDSERQLAASIVHCGKSQGWLSGTPLGVESPGLMTGLAGIGYGLLRLCCRDQVPSVLALEGPRITGTAQ